MQANYVQRIRLRIGKSGPTRFIGHLDLARTLERSLNRARIPLAYTQGFNRRPRMQLADALPLGYTSQHELVDIWLAKKADPNRIQVELALVLPAGIDLHKVTEVELSLPALQNQTSDSTYVVTPGEQMAPGELRDRVAGLLKRSEIPSVRKGKAYDLRPRILALSVVGNQGKGAQIEMRLSLVPGEIARPDEVLTALELEPVMARVHRTRITLANERN